MVEWFSKIVHCLGWKTCLFLSSNWDSITVEKHEGETALFYNKSPHRKLGLRMVSGEVALAE